MSLRALLASLAIAHLVFPMSLLAAPTWTEAEAVAAFLAQSPAMEAARRRLGLATAETVGAGAWDNPSIDLEREQVFAPGGATDRNRLGLQWPLPLTGKQGLRRAIAQVGVDAAQAELDQEAFHQVQEFRAIYAKAYFAEERARVLTENLGVLQRLDRIVAARTRAGESAGYDLMRLHLAKASLDARLKSAEAAAREERAKLYGSLGKPVEGSLRLDLPLTPPPEPQELLAMASRRKDLSVLRAEQEKSRLSRQLAERLAWSDPSISLGFTQAKEPTVQGSGYVAGLAWPLPLFSHGQQEAARAAAQSERLKADESALRQRLSAEIPPSREAFLIRLRTIETYRREALARLPELLRIAEVSYQEGETPVVSLLDAHQAAVETHLQYLSLRGDTQSALLALERLIGEPFTTLKRP